MKADRILIAVAVVGAAAVAALAQAPYVPPQEAGPALSAATPWAAIMVSLVAAVAICIMGFKSSHRTHLD